MMLAIVRYNSQGIIFFYDVRRWFVTRIMTTSRDQPKIPYKNSVSGCR